LSRNKIEAQKFVEHGPIVEVITSVAEREEADLIVMAGCGRTGLARVFYGTVSQIGVWKMETVISLLPNDEHLAAARRELASAGFTQNRITVLFQPADVWQRLGGHQKVRAVVKKAVLGGVIGLLVGALYGIPAGIFNCQFMNCSLETSVVLWALITLFWILAGGFFGSIIGIDGLERDLYSYVEGVRRGEALVVVETPEEQALEARRILLQEQGTAVHEIHQGTVGQ
jgi:hypothetical protein